MELGNMKVKGVAARLPKKTNTTKATTNISILIETFVHLDSDGVQAVSDLLQLRVAFTNLLRPEKKEILELKTKIA